MITHTQGGRTFTQTQKKWANISIPEVRWTCSWHFAPAASTPPSSSLQPWHLITADSQLTHARITNLFHFSSIPLMTPVRSATYLYPCYPQTQVSLFLCLEPKLMWQHSWGRKMNIVVPLFIVLKGTATYSGLLWRLYLEVNYSPMRTYCRAIWSFFMSLIFLRRWCHCLCAKPCILCSDSASQKVSTTGHALRHKWCNSGERFKNITKRSLCVFVIMWRLYRRASQTPHSKDCVTWLINTDLWIRGEKKGERHSVRDGKRYREQTSQPQSITSSINIWSG